MKNTSMNGSPYGSQRTPKSSQTVEKIAKRQHNTKEENSSNNSLNKNEINNIILKQMNEEIYQDPLDSEVNSLNFKNNKIKNKFNTIKLCLWNCRSLKYEKRSLLNSRSDDIIILNETWDNKVNVSGYNHLENKRVEKRSGGVAFLAEEKLELKLLDDSIEDTILVKVF